MDAIIVAINVEGHFVTAVIAGCGFTAITKDEDFTVTKVVDCDFAAILVESGDFTAVRAIDDDFIATIVINSHDQRPIIDIYLPYFIKALNDCE